MRGMSFAAILPSDFVAVYFNDNAWKMHKYLIQHISTCEIYGKISLIIEMEKVFRHVFFKFVNILVTPCCIDSR